MSNPKIPLLTDIVADSASEDGGHIQTQQIFPRPTLTTDGAQAPHEHERFAIFEPDFRRMSHADAGLAAREILEHEPAEHADAQMTEARESGAEHREETLEIEDIETVIAELQTRLASSTFELIDTHLRTAFSDMEARIFREISTNLREQLPELIDQVVRDQLQERRNQTDEGD